MECQRTTTEGRPCRAAPIPDANLCIEHLLMEACDERSGLPTETIVEALVQIVDGALKGATVPQQLSALDLLGQFAGLDEPGT